MEILDKFIHAYLQEKFKSLKANGISKVSIFGNGFHTQWLLAIIINSDGPKIESIYDDKAPEGNHPLFDLPILRPSTKNLKDKYLILSTDCHQQAMTTRLNQLELDSKKYINLYEGLPKGPYFKDLKNQNLFTPKTNLKNDQLYLDQAKHRKAKVVVYTAITGDFDTLKNPESLNPDWDYVCFTNDTLTKGSIFKTRPIKHTFSCPRKTARYIKTHPHELLADYDFSIWIDANILIRSTYLNKCVNDLLNSEFTASFRKHPTRISTQEEAAECILRKNDKPQIIDRQMCEYEELGFPDSAELIETNILLRKHNNPPQIHFNEIWWKEIETKSIRDQLSVMYALWKTNISYKLLPDIGDIRNCLHKDLIALKHNK